ncbi:MAG TPA: hypothetical protein VGK73_04510 [Polyangiaceae bacterium]
MIGNIALVLFAAAGSPNLDGMSSARDPRFDSGERSAARSERERDVRDQWLLSLEGVTRIPLDVGPQIGIETPFGLRLFGSYGWVPQAYIGTLTGIAANATNDARAASVLRLVEYSGNTARVTLGVRPFRKLGFYVDAGYAHVRLNASRDLPDIDIPGVVVLRGGYRATTGLDLWVAELGYQIQIQRRLVLAAGLGVVGTLDAATTITPVGGAPDDPTIRAEAVRRIDRSFESYGYVPTLTLRIGFDLI